MSKQWAIRWTADDIAGEIPERATITLRLQNSRIDIKLRDGVVLVYGDDGLLIKPKATNAFSIMSES
jgi:hypothetical protein